MSDIAVISDVHANLHALKAALLTMEDIDRIYILGDLVGIGPQPSEVLDLIMDDGRFRCVMGNHEHNTVHDTELGPTEKFPRRPHHTWVRSRLSGEQMDFLAGLPMSLHLDLGGTRVGLMHRHPSDCGSRVPYFPHPEPSVLDGFYSDVEGDALFFGHTHTYLNMTGLGGRLYVNPGAIGAQNGGYASYVTVSGDLEINRVQVRYDMERVRDLISTLEVPNHRFILSHFF